MGGECRGQCRAWRFRRPQYLSTAERDAGRVSRSDDAVLRLCQEHSFDCRVQHSGVRWHVTAKLPRLLPLAPR